MSIARAEAARTAAVREHDGAVRSIDRRQFALDERVSGRDLEGLVHDTLLPSLHAGGIRLRHLASLPTGRALEWLDRTCLVEVDDCIELRGQPRAQVMAHALGVGSIDDADRALEPRLLQAAGRFAEVAQREEEARETRAMEQLLVASRQSRAHVLALRWTTPVRRGGD